MDFDKDKDGGLVRGSTTPNIANNLMEKSNIMKDLDV